jgi:predicted porin
MIMQKKIIALAIAGALAAPAIALADASVYGTIDTWVGSISGSDTKSQMLVGSSGLSPTRIGFKGSEDVGSGTKVFGVLEYGLDGTDGSGLNGYARKKEVGLTGSWGTLGAGYIQTTAYDWAVKYDPAADSSISSLQNITGSYLSGVTGFIAGAASQGAYGNRAIAYNSPDFSGFNFAVDYTPTVVGTGDLGAPSSATSAESAWQLSGNYGMGPASVGLVYSAVDNLTCTTTTGTETCNQTEWALGGSWDFTVTKLFATYQSTKNSALSGTNHAYSISDTTPAGPGTLVLQYSAASLSTDMSATVGSEAVSGVNPNALTVGYLYPLSKNSTLYAAYSEVKNGNSVGAAPGGQAFTVANGILYGSSIGSNSSGPSSSLVALGIDYKF